MDPGNAAPTLLSRSTVPPPDQSPLLFISDPRLPVSPTSLCLPPFFDPFPHHPVLLPSPPRNLYKFLPSSSAAPSLPPDHYQKLHFDSQPKSRATQINRRSTTHNMGNAIGRKRSVKVMKVDGTTFKLKPPSTVKDALDGYPAGYVVMESEDVKKNGVKAKPLDRDHPLKPKNLYFLVELPKPPPPPTAEVAGGRRVQSGIHMSAKERLESLMLSRRAMSELSSFTRVTAEEGEGGGVRLKMRLPKAEVARLVKESGDPAAAAAKIMELAAARQGGARRVDHNGVPVGGPVSGPISGPISGPLDCTKSGQLKKEKRMRFAPVEEIIG